VPELTESQEWMARDLAALGDSDLGTLVLKKEVGEVVAFARPSHWACARPCPGCFRTGIRGSWRNAC
jgi:hypothetical protein